MPDNNDCVARVRSPETTVNQSGIIAFMPNKMDPPRGNVRRAIIELPAVLKKKKQ